MSWQERRCNAEGFGRPEPFFFLCEERTYSPPARRAGGGIPPVGRARALCEADCALCGERQAMSPGLRTPAAIACAEESVRRFFRLRKPATGSFIAEMGDASSAPSIVFCLRQKKQKRLPAGSRKDVIIYGNLSF